MQPDHPTTERDAESRNALFGEGVLLNGSDATAARRAHMRAMTVARQAAERRHARPGAGQARADRSPKQAAQERTAELHRELARIDAEHRAWLEAHGEHVPALRSHHAPQATVKAAQALASIPTAPDR